MTESHAAVWIDHEEARLFALSRDTAKEWTIRPHDRHVHIHHKAGKGDAGKAPPDKHYFKSVADALKDATEILVTGPGTAKLELVRYLRERAPLIEKKVVAVETLDHPTDGELVKYAHHIFYAADRMRGTEP